jgi:hypothetical protein
MGRGSRCAGPEEEEEEEEKEVCSPVSGGRTIRLCWSWPSNDPPTALRSSVDTGAGDRGGAPAEFAVVAETVGCREDVGSVILRYGGIEFEEHNKFSVVPTNLTLSHCEPLILSL